MRSMPFHTPGPETFKSTYDSEGLPNLDAGDPKPQHQWDVPPFQVCEISFWRRENPTITKFKAGVEDQIEVINSSYHFLTSNAADSNTISFEDAMYITGQEDATKIAADALLTQSDKIRNKEKRRDTACFEIRQLIRRLYTDDSMQPIERDKSKVKHMLPDEIMEYIQDLPNRLNGKIPQIQLTQLKQEVAGIIHFRSLQEII